MTNNPKNDRILNADNDITNNEDLPDRPEDIEKMKPETVIMDLPEVKDIPGQEFIHVPPLGQLADTTISSDDEEGVGILDYEGDDEDLISNTSVKVTNQEHELPTDTGTPIKDGGELKQATVDNEDEERDLRIK